MAILKIKQPNGSWAIVGDTSETIKFTEQQLTEEQKQVARENIGASSVGKPGTGEGAEIFNSYANNVASGKNAHAEGHATQAVGEVSHAEGNETLAEGNYSHAEGWATKALHAFSHAQGQATKTSNSSQTVMGRYNGDNSQALLIVGNGERIDNKTVSRSNAFEVLADGRARLPQFTSEKADFTKLTSSDIVTKSYIDFVKSDLEQTIPTVLCDITYNDLKSLRDNKELSPGTFYRIRDYQCTTTQEGTRAVNNCKFNIIIQALSNSSLSENAQASCLNPSVNIPVYYKIPVQGYHEGGFAIGAAQVLPNNEGISTLVLFEANSADIAYYEGPYEINGELYDRWRIIEDGTEDMFYHTWEAEQKKYLITNRVVEEDHLTVKPEEIEICYVIYDGAEVYGMQDEGSDVIVEATYIPNADGEMRPVLYKTDLDDYPNEPDYNDPLEYVGRYTLEDTEYDMWQCVPIGDNGLIYGYWLTEIVVDENGKFMDKIYEELDSSTNTSAWELKYCLDNDTTRFAWADEENGKGVIYYMKDEQNNECPYDFKNIQFIRPIREGYIYDKEQGTDTWVYTFSAYDSESLSQVDASSIYLRGTHGERIVRCLNNSIKECRPDDRNNPLSNKLLLNDIVFLGRLQIPSYASNWSACTYIGNHFNYNCSNNTLCNDCCFNTFGCYCEGNVLDWQCRYNTFENYCKFNILDTLCINNTLKTGSSHNSLGLRSQNNHLDEYCLYCELAQDCSNIICEPKCEAILIKTYASQYIKFGAGCSYIHLTNNEIYGSEENPVKNITCCQGVRGTSEQPLELYVQRNAAPVVYEAPGTTHIILD